MTQSAQATVHPQAHSPSSIAFNLGALALAISMLGLGLAYLIDSAGRSARSDSEDSAARTVVTRTLSGTDLSIPLNWFRYAEQPAEGLAKQVELRFTLPLGPKGALTQVDATLMPRSRVRPSANLLDGVYLHQFMPEQLSGPPGLVGKPMRAQDGYTGETVWYDALSASPFVAKCEAPVAEGTPGRCLRTVYLGPGIAAVYTFGADALMGWRQFDTELEQRFRAIGAL